MITETIPYFEDEVSKLKPELPVVERNTINAIIYDPATDSVLCLDWEKFGWKTFIIGGMEDEEDAVVSAKREILEETGYKNLELIGEVGKTRSGYFAAHKNENRISNAIGLLFRLVNNEQEAVKESESLNHVFTWIKKAEVGDYINLSSQKYIWEKALRSLKNI